MTASLASLRQSYREQLAAEQRAIVERGMASSYMVGARVLSEAERQQPPTEALGPLSELRQTMDEHQPIDGPLSRLCAAWPGAFA